MAKGRPVSRAPKSARDTAIDKALLAAARDGNANGGGAFLIRPTRRDEAAEAAPAKSTTAKPAGATKPKNAKAKAAAANANTAMAQALAKAGIAPSPQAEPKALQPPPKAQQRLEAPAPTKAPPRAPEPPSVKATPITPKAATKDEPKPPKDKSKQKEAKRLLALRIKADAKERAKQIKRAAKIADEKARGERMKERQKKAAREIANISQATPDELLNLWRENIARIDNEQSAFRGLAKDYIDAIESEWTRRSIIARLDPNYFKWPSTTAAPGNGSFAALDHAEGILGYLGYHVGKTGEPSSARRQTLLSRAFEGPLPPINGPDYMREWDRPESAVRLEKMAVSIASAVKSAKRRRHADYSVAIEHWEEDLRFLHRTYYIGRFGFDWPGNTSAGRV